MHCLEVWTQDSEYESTVHMFLASLPHGLREVWIECTTSTRHQRHYTNTPLHERHYTNLVVGYQGTSSFDTLGWSACFDDDLKKNLHGLRKCLFLSIYLRTRAALSDIVLVCICDRENKRDFKDASCGSFRLAKRGVKFLFSIVELLNQLRNIEAHLGDFDIGNFVRRKYPFLLSHVWHVRSESHLRHSLLEYSRERGSSPPLASQVLRFFKDELKVKAKALHNAVPFWGPC